jgi:hypothetical protein
MVADEAQSFATHTKLVGRKRSRLCITLQLGLAILLSPYLTHAFQSHHPFRRSSSSLKAALSGLTVKELRDLVKQSSAERGVLSSLKKKQDLIAYLEDNHTRGRSLLPNNSGVAIEPEMTNLQNGEIQSLTASQLHPEEPSLIKNTGSPKDAIFEKVYERYPITRDAPEPVMTTPADDIRQLHHPIFRNSIASSDMDVVFVGTASCTPGVTRGVSCTALRLNWRPRGAFGASNDGDQPSTFYGGTWLFDVGECTQVC